VKETGQYDNTYIMVTSDNGYQLGQHRMHNKLDPYRMSTTAPLLVAGPNVDTVAEASHLLAHIDLCPTILDLAQCPKPDFLDGKSFAELIRDPKAHEDTTWRDPVLLENWQVKRNRKSLLPGTYSGLRYHDKLYVEWMTGDREFYDLKSDPYELENTFDALSLEEKQQLREDLFATRSVEMDPIVNVIPREVLTVHKKFPYCVRGVAEDDRCIEKIEVMIRHLKKGYWNGTSFQKGRTRVTVTDFASDQQMVSWRYDIRDLVSLLGEEDTETVEGEKKFRVVLQAFAWDQKGNRSQESRTQMLMPFTNDPFLSPTTRTKTAARPKMVK